MNDLPIVLLMAVYAAIGGIVGWEVCNIYHEVKDKNQKGESATQP